MRSHMNSIARKLLGVVNRNPQITDWARRVAAQSPTPRKFISHLQAPFFFFFPSFPPSRMRPPAALSTAIPAERPSCLDTTYIQHKGPWSVAATPKATLSPILPCRPRPSKRSGRTRGCSSLACMQKGEQFSITSGSYDLSCLAFSHKGSRTDSVGPECQ